MADVGSSGLPGEDGQRVEIRMQPQIADRSERMLATGDAVVEAVRGTHTSRGRGRQLP
ncbi:hypothetical protein [Amycolatopsis sp. cmx-11-51]|uniref:hypothetical protein n=1 Tax=unclassified Amycolatopsis TaxID=2618356 RepID=UPI0039E520E3